MAQTYASYAPRFKPPKFRNKNKLLKTATGNNDFILNKNVSQLNIVLFGCGSIGSKLLHTIIENRNLHQSLFNQRYNIKAIFDSSGFVYNGSRTGDYNSSIDDAQVINILNWKSKKEPLRVYRDIGYYYNDFEAKRPALLGGNNTILIDATNESEKLQDVFLEHGKKGGGIIMANKKQLSSAQHVFDNLTSPERLPRIGYEATVGGCLPFVNTLQDLIVSGDNVYRLEGILSGSVGWMLTKWQRMKNSNLDYVKQKGLFADIIMEAHAEKLSEPDPRDDILGIDSARKAVILARTCGINCEVEDVLKNTTSLLPMDRRKLMEMTPEEFTRYIKNVDENELEQYLLEKCVNYTRGHRMNLKYVTLIDTESEEIRIELRNYNGDKFNDDGFSLFKYVHGTNNILQYHTDRHPSNNPLTIQGVSTGREVSVNAMMTDLHQIGVAINHTY